MGPRKGSGNHAEGGVRVRRWAAAGRRAPHDAMSQKLIDMTGKVYGTFEVLERTANVFYGNQQHTAWNLECRACGRIVVREGRYLRTNPNMHCKCTPNPNRKLDFSLIGKVYDDFKVVGRDGGAHVLRCVHCRKTIKRQKQQLESRKRIMVCQCRVNPKPGDVFGAYSVMDTVPVSFWGKKSRNKDFLFWNLKCRKCGRTVLVSQATLARWAIQSPRKCQCERKYKRFSYGSVVLSA